MVDLAESRTDRVLGRPRQRDREEGRYGANEPGDSYADARRYDNLFGGEIGL
jgi:hypothetical protein